MSLSGLLASGLSLKRWDTGWLRLDGGKKGRRLVYEVLRELDLWEEKAAWQEETEKALKGLQAERR